MKSLQPLLETNIINRSKPNVLKLTLFDHNQPVFGSPVALGLFLLKTQDTTGDCGVFASIRGRPCFHLGFQGIVS